MVEIYKEQNNIIESSTNINEPIIYFSRFNASREGYGGGLRRTTQLYYALKPLGCQIITTKASIDETCLLEGKKNNKLNLWFKKFITLKGETLLWNGKHLNRVYNLRKLSRYWANTFLSRNIIDKIKCVVIDDPIYFIPLIKKIANTNIILIAHCHNFETLEHRQNKINNVLKIFKKEIQVLAKCDLVITTSKEDSVLLNNFGVRSLYFPYYPIEEIECRLNIIKEKRNKSKKKNILFAGSATNEATKEGMSKIIEYWEKNEFYNSGEKLIIAGYATDRAFKKYISNEKVDFLGEINNENFDSLLSTVKAAICYQERGSGALTRIPELLIAGIPILANSHAARSCELNPGLIKFEGLDELTNLIHNIKFDKIKFNETKKPNPKNLYQEINKYLTEQNK